MLQLLGDQEGAIVKGAFSGDDRLLLTLNRGHNRVLIWDARNGERLAALDSGLEEFYDVSLAASGKWFVTSCSDASARIWPVAPSADAAARLSRLLTPDERDTYHVGTDAQRSADRLEWSTKAVGGFFATASRSLTRGTNGEVVRAILADRLTELLKSVPTKSSQARLAALEKVERIANQQGGAAPMVKLVLADAYQKHGGAKQAARLLAGLQRTDASSAEDSHSN